MRDYNLIKNNDPTLYSAIMDELSRQRNKIELIASENFVSETVMEASSTILTNKYAEGYPALASLTLVTNFFCHVHTCCAVLWPWKCMLSAKFPINACGPGFSRISSHWTVSLDSLAANTLSALHCIPLA